MTVPYVPTPNVTPIINPAVGSTGAPPIAYLSNAQYQFAPTAMNVGDLTPGSGRQAQQRALTDVIARASSWCDSICFGSDSATKGASLAASLTVDSATIRIKNGQLRLLCDYRPLVALVGVATGWGLSTLSPLDPTLFGMARVGRLSWTLPYWGSGLITRSGDVSGVAPATWTAGSVYTVWSYVNGYPHTSLALNIAAGATSCVVNAADGAGGLWGVFPASAPFPGTQLRIVDGATTESVFVEAVAAASPSAGLTTLTTTAFTYAHTPPVNDFLPVTTIPENVVQATISLVTMLIKTRGVRGLVMPTTPGGTPSQASKEKLGQAGALEDYEIACRLLNDAGLIVRVRHPGSY